MKRVSLCRVAVDWPAEGQATLGVCKGEIVAVSKEAERGWVYGEPLAGILQRARLDVLGGLEMVCIGGDGEGLLLLYCGSLLSIRSHILYIYPEGRCPRRLICVIS